MKSEISASGPGHAATQSRSASWLRPKYLLFVFIACMYAYVLLHNESFVFRSSDPEWPHIHPFRWWLLPHGLVAACALFLGPLQFSDRLRKRFAKFHRVAGRFYVGGVLIGAPLGIYIQHFEERMGETRSFTIAAGADAVLWIFATLVALTFILKGNVSQHRQWMTRSFSCALIFLEVRVVLGVFKIPERFSEAVVWSCVAAAYPIADFVLYGTELFRRRAAKARTTKPIPQPIREIAEPVSS
jgi:uncharacterized membrane protein